MAATEPIVTRQTINHRFNFPVGNYIHKTMPPTAHANNPENGNGSTSQALNAPSAAVRSGEKTVATIQEITHKIISHHVHFVGWIKCHGRRFDNHQSSVAATTAYKDSSRAVVGIPATVVRERYAGHTRITAAKP